MARSSLRGGPSRDLAIQPGDGEAPRLLQEALGTLDTPEALASWFRDRIRAFGFTTHAAGLLSSPTRVFYLLDWPRTWLELYAARGFAQGDVIVAEALRSPDPFTWTEIRDRIPGASAEVFAAAATFGWHEGLVVPVHGPGEDRGIVSLAGSGPAIAGPDRERLILLCLMTYERARRLSDRGITREHLSTRERTVLSLVASGRTDGEIGDELGLSRATAHFHVEAAKRRLGAKTRAHAVALAMSHGMI